MVQMKLIRYSTGLLNEFVRICQHGRYLSSSGDTANTALFKCSQTKMSLFKNDFMKTPLWLAKKPANVQMPFEGFKFLDVGCGAGSNAQALAHLGADVTGIDISPSVIKIVEKECAKDSAISAKVKFIQTTVEDHATAYEEQYDGLVCTFVMEYADNQEYFLRSCSRLVKAGGSVFFISLNTSFEAFWRVVFLAQFVFAVFERGSITRKDFVRPDDLRVWIRENSLSFRSSCGLQVDPRTGDWTLHREKEAFYYMTAVKY